MVALSAWGASAAATGAAQADGVSLDPSGAKPESVSALIRVGPRHALTSIAQAARVARDGDVVEVDSGFYPGDVTVWPQSHLTVRAVGGRARVTQRNKSAERKALWVCKGDDVSVENFEFSGARVPDLNGAGIRHEGGRLTVRNCLFEDNQMGLLTWNNPQAELTVENSEFRDNAVAQVYHPGDRIGHQIYAGSIARFTLRECYVHRGAFGHLVKSRARASYIVNNRITDEAQGRSSYELEFPNGGLCYVLGNIIQQNARTQNLQVVSCGAEGYRWPKNELYLVNNTLVDDAPRGGRFLRVWPGSGRVVVTNNLLLGNATLDSDRRWELSSNWVARPADFVAPGEGDYRLRATSPLAGKAVEPGFANGIPLRPDREYPVPMQGRPVATGSLNPGALQSVVR